MLQDKCCLSTSLRTLYAYKRISPFYLWIEVTIELCWGIDNLSVEYLYQFVKFLLFHINVVLFPAQS